MLQKLGIFFLLFLQLASQVLSLGSCVLAQAGELVDSVLLLIQSMSFYQITTFVVVSDLFLYSVLNKRGVRPMQ